MPGGRKNPPAPSAGLPPSPSATALPPLGGGRHCPVLGFRKAGLVSLVTCPHDRDIDTSLYHEGWQAERWLPLMGSCPWSLHTHRPMGPASGDLSGHLRADCQMGTPGRPRVGAHLPSPQWQALLHLSGAASLPGCTQ